MIAGEVLIDTSGAAALLSEAKQRRITLKGAKAAGKILKTASRAGAPRRVGSGALQQSQGVKAAKGTRGTTVSYAVQGARKKVVKFVKFAGRRNPVKVVPAFYDHLVQLGTKPHTIGKHGGKHPGARANDYRHRAWLSVKDQAGTAAMQVMAAETQKLLAKQKAKYGK